MISKRYRILVNLTSEEFDRISKLADAIGEDRATFIKMIIIEFLNKK